MPISPTSSVDDIPALIDMAFERLLQGESLADFSAWFAAQAGPQGMDLVDEPLAAIAMARALWGAVPMPANRWRSRGLPRLERNDPCYCGSGRKYKHCCVQWGHVGLPFESDMLTALAIQHAPPEALGVASLRTLPPLALAQAAAFWQDSGRAEQIVRVLAPLFEDGSGLDERHEAAFDLLMDAMLSLGQQTRRLELVRQISRHRDKVLATTARCRHVSMLADEGDFEQAWVVFRQAQRDAPDDPQLWQLELITLLHQGRTDEARLRGPLLVAKARRAGLDDLAEVLQRLASQGIHAVYQHIGASPDDARADDLTRDWLALCAGVPDALDPEACRALYRIEVKPAPRARAKPVAGDALVAGLGWLRVLPAPALAALERRWQRRFPVRKPDMTLLLGDADALLEDAPSAAEFLCAHPEGWLSVQMLDDLLLAAQERVYRNMPAVEMQAAWRLAEHALRVLQALWHEAPDAATARQARLGADWSHAGTRPLLRLLAQVIGIGRLLQRDMLVLAEWGLALNPIDNHGWRQEVVDAYIHQDRFDAALELLARYPDDLPPALHRRALALYALGRHDEAQDELRQAHADYPAFLQALWPEVLDPPEPDAGFGISIGGAQAAFDYRAGARADWVRTGALNWSRDLDLPVDPGPRKTVRTGTGKTVAAVDRVAVATALPARQRQRLQRHYDWPRLHGLLTAIAWSPDLVMPNRWLPQAVQLRLAAPSGAEAARLKTLNNDLEAVMRLYNSLAAPLVDGSADAPMPLQLTRELAGAGAGPDDDALLAWASGFVQGAELSAAAWRRAGRPVLAKPRQQGGGATFAALYALAARAARSQADEPARLPAWQPPQDDGQPLLVGLASHDTLPVAEQLQLVLTDLWRVTLPLRLARAEGAPEGMLQFSSFSLDADDD